MDTIKIKDKSFRVFMQETDIKQRVKALAEQMSKDLEGKNPIFLGVLNGSFIFAADLMREMTIPCEISFVKLASYQGTTSTGKVKEVIGIKYQIGLKIKILLKKDLIMLLLDQYNSINLNEIK